MRKLTSFLFAVFLGMIVFSKTYTIDELLKLVERNVQYDYLKKEITLVNRFVSSSKINVFPFNDQDQTGDWNFKLTLLDSLTFFSDVDYYSKRFDFENGVEWSLIDEDNSKNVLKAVISKKLRLIDIYFNLLRVRNSISRLKESINQVDNMWNTTLPIDYGLSRIEENYLIETIKSMCGIVGEFDIPTLKMDVSTLKININSVLNAVVYLNSTQRKPPKLSLIFSFSNNFTHPEVPRLNAGFNFSWENIKSEQNHLSDEILKAKKLYSQFEYLKDVLKSYRENLRKLKKDGPEYNNVRRIIEDYTVETYRLYYQLRILEEIIK